MVVAIMHIQREAANWLFIVLVLFQIHFVIFNTLYYRYIHTRMTSSFHDLLHSTHGFQTKCWGPPMWFVLHLISLNYQPSLRSGYVRFFKSLEHVLPCKACRINYAKTVRTHPTLQMTKDTFESRESLVLWLFKLHNYVTRCNTDKTPFYKDTRGDFEKMVRYYSKFRATCRLPTKTDHGGCNRPVKGGIRIKTKLKFVPCKR